MKSTTLFGLFLATIMLASACGGPSNTVETSEAQEVAAGEGKTLPIIFITAEDSIRSRAMTAGAVCFLTKPFDGRQLIQCIEAALTR